MGKADTSGADGQRQRGVFDVDEDRAIDALRMSWGDVFDIGREHCQWVATYQDGRGVVLTRETPDELNAKMRADWTRRGGAVSVPERPPLRIVLGDEMTRLIRFRTDHPGLFIGDGGFGTWQGRIPEPSGETVITRHTLRELLDKLDELLNER